MTRSRQSVLAAWQVEEQAYQSFHSRDFEGLTSGTRAVHKRKVRTVGEVRQPCVCVCVCVCVHVCMCCLKGCLPGVSIFGQ